MRDYDFIGSYDNQRYSGINAERTINMFEYIDANAKRPKVLLPTSGLIETNLTFPEASGGSRGSWVFKNAIFQVFGQHLYKITGYGPGLSAQKIGEFSTSVGYVGADANDSQILFVDGEYGYIYDTDVDFFVRVIDPAFPVKPPDCTFLDDFFVVPEGESPNFQLSLFRNGLVWGVSSSREDNGILATASTTNNWLTIPGDGQKFQTTVPCKVFKEGAGVLPTPLTENSIYYAIYVDSNHIRLAENKFNAKNGIFIPITSSGTAPFYVTNSGQFQQGRITSHPGDIVGCRTLHRRLFLFSENFTEIWENAGIGANLPFRRNNSLLMEVGTPSVGSIATGFNKLFFLSQDKDGISSVMEVSGTQNVPISNRALDYTLAQYASTHALDGDNYIEDSRGLVIKENGLIFYRLNFTDANHTYVYNETMSDPQNTRWHEEQVLNGDRHPGQSHAYLSGINYYAHYNTPKMYIVSPTYYRNGNEKIPRIRIGKIGAPPGYERIRVDRFQLDLLQGQADQDLEEAVTLSTESGIELTTEGGDLIQVDELTVSFYETPTVYLSISKDGGQTFGELLPGALGAYGDRTARTVWRKLGTTPNGQGFLPKIEFYHDYPFIVLGAAWAPSILPE